MALRVSNEPVLLIVFNRPDEVAASLEALSTIHEGGRLYVAGDGPRDGHQQDERNVRKVWEVVESFSINFDTHLRQSPVNLGCRRGVVSAIDWFFECEESGIILEDDITPTQQFLDFCTHHLSLHRSDPRISSISGCNPGAHLMSDINPYVFSAFNFIWGWACWRRSWKMYRRDMEGYAEWYEAGHLREHFWGSRSSEDYWNLVFQGVFLGQVDTWDAQWAFSCWYNSTLCVMPHKNLVNNTGFNGEATHTVADAPEFLDLMITPEEKLDLVFRDSEIVRNQSLDRIINRSLYNTSLFHYYKRKARKFLLGG